MVVATELIPIVGNLLSHIIERRFKPGGQEIWPASGRFATVSDPNCN